MTETKESQRVKHSTSLQTKTTKKRGTNGKGFLKIRKDRNLRLYSEESKTRTR